MVLPVAGSGPSDSLFQQSIRVTGAQSVAAVKVIQIGWAEIDGFALTRSSDNDRRLPTRRCKDGRSGVGTSLRVFSVSSGEYEAR